MNRRKWLGLGLVSIGIGLVGCGTPLENVDPKAENLSIVAGYIDMREAPSRLGWVSIKAYGPGTDHHYRARVEDGVFFHIGVDPGSYQIDRFGGQGGWAAFGGAAHEYEWGTRGRNATAIRIERPGVYFMGSYRYAPQRTGLLEAGKFQMNSTSTPSEREVLQRVLRTVEGDPALKGYALQIQRLRQSIGP